MSSWLKKIRKQEPLPQLEDHPGTGENPANPGVTQEGVWTFNDGDREWQEQMNLVQTLRHVLEEGGHQCEVDGPVILCGGLSLRPLLASMTPVHKEGVRTCTTIEVKHQSSIPVPVFEYQHSLGADLESSLRKGFEGWRDLDLVPLIDSLTQDSETCGEINWKGRRIVLGPVAHMRQHSAPLRSADDNHDFCPCCLFTSSMSAFEELVDSKDFLAFRLFASRSGNGEFVADCRVNGEDFAAGQEALLLYASSWPNAGFEYRKQYVVVPRG